MKMKLEHYILGLLSINPSTGYDIKKFLDTEGRFDRRRAPLSQIYTTLKRMMENNLVTFEEEKREGKPDIKIYSITQQGINALIEFLHNPNKQTFRYSGENSLLFRVRYAFLVKPEVIVQQIQDELAFRHEQIRKFRHRNRTIRSTALTTQELANAQAINDELHSYGAQRMDRYVAYLESMLTFFEEQQVDNAVSTIA
ncbi:MAG: PadR family transcriptional regulator [Ardenticatenaceae bacterium]|nr:PadR family transcriptional regulator [Ardenticatenaceae bacterium]